MALGVLLLAAGIGFWLTRGGRRAWLYVAACSLLSGAVLSDRTPSGAWVLLTEGSSEAQRAALGSRPTEPARILDLASPHRTRELPGAETRRDLAYWFRSAQEEPTSVEVFGWGLHAWDWRRLDRSVDRFEPPGPLRGLSEIYWSRQLRLGEPLELSGFLRQEGTLRLIGPAGEEDAASIEVTEGVDGAAFRLGTVPRAAGRLLFRLQFESSDGTISTRDIPVAVEPAQTPAVLWLESAPSFESRAVRNWLTDLGAPVAVGARITRGRDRWQQANLGLDPELSTERVLDHLDRFDLLVLDLQSWPDLTISQRQRIEQEIVQDGLGLLVLFGGSNPLPPIELPLAGLEPLADDGAVEPRPLRLWWAGAESQTPLLPGLERGWRLDGETQPLVVSDGGTALAAWRPWGRGRVAGSQLGETFPWLLQGEGKAHHRLWSHLIEELARPGRGERWRWRSGPVLRDQPLDLVLQTAATPPEITLTDPTGHQARLAPWQEVDHWRVTWRPRATGWHRLATTESEAWLFVSPPTDWTDWDRAERYRATQTATRALEAPEPPPTPAPRPAPWFWALGTLLLLLVWTAEGLGWWARSSGSGTQVGEEP